jgi:predicted lipoprotein with Yx(FWY)xxD motif
VRRLLPLPIVLLAALLTACGSSSTPTHPAAPSGGGSGAGSAASLSTKNLSGLGVVLVNGEGRTLYVFAPDMAKKVTCTGSCAQVWPPLKVSAGQKPSMSGGVKASLVASASSPEGGQVVTYHGWPLYTYVADASPGTAHGQALNNSGGLWYVISPTGQVIKKHAGAASSKGGSGY